jgi:hypothetical protein
VARRATAIKTERSIDAPVMLLSGGDFCGEQGIVERDRSRFLATTMVEEGYAAVAVGERELNYGVRALKEMAEGGLPLICANLYEGSDRVVPPYVVRKIGGTRVGVFALLGERPRELAGVELRDPEAEGHAALEELRGRCDCVILLAHMSRDSLAAMLPALDGVDLVIRAHVREGEQARESCADTLVAVREHATLPVFFSGDRGRNIGVVTLAGEPGGTIAVVSSRLIRLDRGVAEDPDAAKSVAAYREKEGVRRREVELAASLAWDQRTGRLVERYLGMEVCRRCHADLMPRFVATGHARALETLRERAQAENPSCLACHTTGYARPTGYDPASEKTGAVYLGGVQCEACHGPGTMHARDGSYVKGARQGCRVCHTSTWSPDFDFETYWARVSHVARRDSS